VNFALDDGNPSRSPAASEGPSEGPSRGTSRHPGGASRTALRGTAIEKKRTANPSSYSHFASLGMDSRTRPVLPQNRLSGAAARRSRSSNRAPAEPHPPSRPFPGDREIGVGLVVVCAMSPGSQIRWHRGGSFVLCLDGAANGLVDSVDPRWAPFCRRNVRDHGVGDDSIRDDATLDDTTAHRPRSALWKTCGKLGAPGGAWRFSSVISG
jgi:hypothetical protein